MDEKALDDLYSESIRRGYRGSKEEFIQILYSDSAAFDDMFAYATYNGYNGSADDFSELIGKKKSHQIPEWTLTEQAQAAQDLVRRKKEQEQQQQVVKKQEVVEEKAAAPAAMESSLVAPSSALPSTDNFAKSLSKLTTDIIDLDEEDAVPKLNDIFREQGFKFEQTGFGDKVEVTAPNKQKKTFSIDMFTKSGDQQVVNDMKAWIQQNKTDFSAKEAELSEQDFEKSLSTIDAGLASQDEDMSIPYLQEMFKGYGFSFKTEGMGDNITVTAPNGAEMTIAVDRFGKAANEESAKRLKNFMDMYRPAMPKMTEQYNKYESRIRTEEDLKNVKESFNNEVTYIRGLQREAVIENASLEKEAKALQSVPQSQRGTQQYMDRLASYNERKAALTQNINMLSQAEKDIQLKSSQLDVSIGRYTAMKAEQGSMGWGIVKKFLGEYGSMTSAMSGISLDLMSAAMPEILAPEADKQLKFLEIAEDKGVEVPKEIRMELLGKKAELEKYEESLKSLPPEERKKKIEEYEKTRVRLYKGSEMFDAWAKANFSEDEIGKINDNVNDFFLKSAKADILPDIRTSLSKYVTGATEEYLQTGGIIKQGILGLAGSAPAMLSGGPAARVVAFGLQGYDATMREMSSPEFKDVSEGEKYMVALPIAIASGVLEEFGFRNAIGKSGIVNDIVTKAIGKAGAGASASTFKELVENEVKSRAARGLLTAAGATLAEAETGALQEASAITIKQIYNAVKDKELFQTPQSVTEWFEQVGEAAAAEAVGGFIMGAPSSVSTAISERNYNGITDKDVALFSLMANDANIKEAYALKIKQGITSGQITEEKGKALLESYDKGVSAVNAMPEGLNPAAQRKAIGLLIEKSELQKQVEGKDEAMVKKQKARIAEINSELEKVSEMKEEAAPSEAPSVAPSEAKPITYDQLSDEAKTMVEREVDLYQSNIDAAKENNREPDEWDVSQLELLKSDPVAFLEEVVSTTSNEERKTLAEQALTKIKEEQDAIQVETAGQVPVQPTARPSEEVAQGEPQAEPQVTAQAGVEEEVSRLEEAFGGAFAETEQLLPVTVEASTLEAVPTERKMEVTFTQEDGTVSPLMGNEQMVSDLYEKAVAIPETQRTAAQQSVVDAVKVSLRTPVTPSGVSVSNKAQVAELETKTTDTNKKKIIKAATTAINTLKSIFPDMDIVIHDNDGSYDSQMGQVNGRTGSAGNFAVTRNAQGKIIGGRIDINLSKANMRTVAHEVAHAVMLKAFGDNPALFKVFRDRITKILSDTTVEKLNDFASQYEENDSHEEFLVELSAALTEAQKQLKPTTVQKIAELINKVVSKITGGKVQPFSGTVQTNELIDFLNTMSSAIGRGEAIQVEGLNEMGLSGRIQVDESVKSKSSIVSGEIRRFDINKNTKVEEDVNLSRFNGTDVNLMESDRMTAGYIVDEKNEAAYSFFGGVLFPAVTGKWWASSNPSTANKIVKNANKNRNADGYIYSAPMVGAPSQHMSNNDMLLATISLMKNDVTGVKGGVKKDKLISQLKKAFSRKDLLNKTDVLKNILKNNTKTADIFNALELILTDTENKTIIGAEGNQMLGEDGKPISSLTFQQRLAVVNTLLGNKKVKDSLFPSAGSVEDVAKRFQEPLTEKAKKVGDLVTLMRTKGTLKYRKTDKNDKFYHKSYPIEIYAEDENGNLAEIELFILDGAYSMRDVVPTLVKSNGEQITWDDYIKRHGAKGEKYAEAQYNRTAKLSSAKGTLTTVSKAQVATEVKEMDKTFTVSKAQVDAYHGSPYDFDRFTTEKIGTGEGAQAFGWGLYFTDLKSIAEGYADKLSDYKIVIPEKYVTALKNNFDYKAGGVAYDLDYFLSRKDQLSARSQIRQGLENAIINLKIKLDKAKELTGSDSSVYKRTLEELTLLKELEEKGIKIEQQKKLYQVSIHQGKTPDQYTWLVWDKPVSEKVKNIVRSKEQYLKGKINESKYITGKETESEKNRILQVVKNELIDDLINSTDISGFYGRLSRILGSDKAASLFLLENGIDGVKYPAESIARGATSDTARGFNYVVFDENAVTIVSKAQKVDQEVRNIVKKARAEGYSEAGIKAFLLKKGFTAQEADALMSKPEAGKKIELGEELMAGYDRMMAEVDGIIEKGLNRRSSQEKIMENVLAYVQGSKAYENATDQQREQIVREVKKAFGEKMKSAPSVGKILGTIKDVKKVTMTEMSLLKKQLTDAAKGAKDLMKVWTKANKKLTAELKDMVRSGSINTKQLVAVLRKFQNTNLLNQDSIDSFIQYMARVFADANYAERISNIRKNLRAAKRNIQTKIGVAESVQPLLQQMLSINPTLIPESVFDKYEALVAMLGQRKAVLELRDIDDVRADVTAVMDAVTAEVSKVPDLADRFENYADKVVDEDGKVQYSETVDKMLEDDVIDADEVAIMRKYRSKIMPAAPKAKMTEAEIAQEKQDLIAAIKATRIEPSKLALRDEKESASQLSKLIDDDVLEKMDNKQLKTLLAVIGNINNGYMPHQAQIIKEVINAKKKQISRSVINAKPLPLSRIYNKLKALISKTNNDIYQMIVSNPLFNIDEVLGNFKAKDIFNALFNDVAKASATYDAAMTKIRNRLDEAYTAVSKSFGNDPAKVNRSSYRMMAYMLQLEHQTNPAGIQTKHSAMDYLEKTIAESEKGNTPYTDADIKMFREILNEMNELKDTDGNVDLDAFYSKFNAAEKNAIKVVQEINIETRDKAIYTSSVIRGDRITPLNNYVHHSLFPDNQPDETITNITTSQNVIAGMNPSTRGKSLIARTGVLSAMNFDVFAATQRGANFVMLDYYMTEPIRTAHRTLNETERALEEEYGGKVPKEKREVFNAIRQAFETAKDDYLTNKMVEDSFFAMVGQELARQGYRAMLASVPRFAAELASNMTFVMTSDPLAMATGVGLTSVVMSSDAPSIMINLKSKNTNRVFSNDTLSGRMVDRGILNETTTKGTRGTKNGIINKIQQIHNNSTKKLKNSMELLADVLIATPDKMMIRPIWFGAFANEFKNITGTKPDFDKIAANDEAYMSENKEALDAATAVADNKSTMAGATDNAFMGILKGNIRVTDDGYVKFFKMFNSFMSRFLIFEYSTARTAVYAAMGKGYLNPKQGAALLAAVALRMTLYTFIVGILSQEMINLFTPDEEEEEEKSLQKKAGQAMAQGFNALLLGRNFGNFTKGIINYGVEWMNEKYLDFLREGEYDPYKDRLAYSYIPSEDKKGEKPSILDFFKNMMGPYTPIFNATELAYQKMKEAQKRAAKEAEEAARPKEMFEKGKSIKEVEAEKVVEERKAKEMSIRIPLELLGSVGMIPLYRDVRKIILNDMYKDLKQAKVEAEKAKAQREADKPPMGLTMSEYKRYFPDEYEARYGEGSEYYNRGKVEDAIIDAENAARRRMLDAFFNYVPKQNIPKDIGKRPLDIKTKAVPTEQSSYVKKQKIGKRPFD